MMPYAKRNESGMIDALYCEARPDANEQLSMYSPEVLSFLRVQESGALPKQFLESSDIDLVRVVEDLVFLLVEKKIILLTDLPENAQKKIITRRCARTKLASDADCLIVEDEEILL